MTLKIKDRSRNVDGIGVRRIRTFAFSSDSVASDPVKTKLSELEEEAEEPTNHNAWNRVFSLVYSSTSASEFSLDRKRRSHNWNRYSASDSDSLIFTRSYRSALLITTPTPSLVKTNNSEAILYKNGSFKLQKESNGMGLKRVAPESMLTL